MGAVAAEWPGIDALVEQMLTGAVVDADRLELFLLQFDDAGIRKLRGIKCIDAEHTGSSHADDAAHCQENGEQQRRRPLKDPEPRARAVRSGPLAATALYENTGVSARPGRAQL